MAKKEIKQKIVLEGEKQYNQAIKDAQRNLRTLKSELKAETAELGKNATEQQKAEAKTRSLNAQIVEQEKVVNTLKEALSEVKQKYGDNAEEVARWEQRLNDARATLANMKNEAATTTVATKSVADALDSIGSAAGSISGVIESIFTGMIDRVTDAVEQVWELISETAAKANNWTDIAGYWGTDAQTIQQYARAVSASAKSFDDLQIAVSKIVMGGKGEKITELLGVSDVNYKNDWSYAMAVMNQLSNLTAMGKDMTPIYEQIFGEKKGTKVMDLVNEWKQIQEMLPEFNGNETGYGMSDEELSTMNDLWVEINKIEERWEGIKDNIAGGFGTVTMDLLVSVEGTLDGIADYLNAKDDAGKQAALDKIRKNVEDFFTKLADVIRQCIGILADVGKELQGSDDPVVSAIGGILTKLAESLQWMVDHQDAVKGAFEAIFGVWLIAKLAAVAGKLAGIIMQIQMITAFKGLSGAAGAAAGAAGAAGGSAAGSGAAGAIGGIVSKVLPVAAGVGLVVADSLNNHGNDDLFNPDGTPTELGRSLGYTQNQEYYDQGGAPKQQSDYIELKFQDAGEALEDKLEEAIEDVDLSEKEYTDEDRDLAVQDWFDAWKDWITGNIDDDEYQSAWDYFDEVFGEKQGDVMEAILQKLNEQEDQTKLEDIPEDWWRTTGNWGKTENEDGVTSTDLQGFRALPGNIQTAVQRGAAAGVSGIKVNLDGRTVGELVAPYVSLEIAKSLN